jgi:hypothetical protein
MKPLAIYLAALLLAFGGLAAVITLSRDTARVFVVVDSSFAMRDVWRQVPGELDTLDDSGYAEFALATEKDLVHSWQDRLRFRESRPYAPCDFTDIETYPEAAEADERVLITTSGSCPTDAFGDWTIISLRP